MQNFYVTIPKVENSISIRYHRSRYLLCRIMHIILKQAMHSCVCHINVKVGKDGGNVKYFILYLWEPVNFPPGGSIKYILS